MGLSFTTFISPLPCHVYPSDWAQSPLSNIYWLDPLLVLSESLRSCCWQAGRFIPVAIKRVHHKMDSSPQQDSAGHAFWAIRKLSFDYRTLCDVPVSRSVCQYPSLVPSWPSMVLLYELYSLMPVLMLLLLSPTVASTVWMLKATLYVCNW